MTLERTLRGVLTRTDYQEEQTLGELVIYEGDVEVFKCKTLERPWRNNKVRDSCIPEGTYPVEYRHSPKFKNMVLPWLRKTEPRTYILIHYGNYNRQIEGCILVGKTHADIDGDGLLDVTSSVATLNELMKVLMKTGDDTKLIPEIHRYLDFNLEIKS